jgi:hypothetical protein
MRKFTNSSLVKKNSEPTKIPVDRKFNYDTSRIICQTYKHSEEPLFDTQ